MFRNDIKRIVKHSGRSFADAIYSTEMNRGLAGFFARLVTIT